MKLFFIVIFKYTHIFKLTGKEATIGQRLLAEVGAPGAGLPGGKGSGRSRDVPEPQAGLSYWQALETFSFQLSVLEST